MRLLILFLLLISSISAADTSDVPEWAVAGILRVESSSFFKNDGSVRYVNKKRGRRGERGCTQLRKNAFNQVKRGKEQYWQVEQDTAFCVEITKRYLLWLYENDANRSWKIAVEKYNAGPRGRSREYLADVVEAAIKDGYTVP